MKKIVTLAAVAAVVLVTGCSGESNTPGEDRAGNQKPKTVVVNEGMSEEDEEKLNERLADLEDEVDDRSAEEQYVEEQPSQQTESAEDAARAAAQAYYAAAASGNYGYTYDELSSYSRSQFTEDEWLAANTELGSDAASYSVDSVNAVDDSIAEVNLTINLPDGSSSGRFTWFVLENGSWKHDLTQEEYDLFAGATAASTNASASPQPTTVEPEETDAEEEDLFDCPDFSTQAEAQAVLYADPDDPYGLDEDGDGSACEDLPGNEQYESSVSVPEFDDEPERERDEPSRQPRLRPPTEAASPPGEDVDCGELKPGEAQRYLLPGDPYDLDRDNDGKACE